MTKNYFLIASTLLTNALFHFYADTTHAHTTTSALSFFEDQSSPAKNANEVIIVNTGVMEQINSLSNALINISPPKAYTSPYTEELKVLELSEFKSAHELELYSQISHEMGVCGGFTKVNNADLARIQQNLIAQRELHYKENHTQFAFQKSVSSNIEEMLNSISSSAFQKDLEFISAFPHRNARQSRNTEIESIKNYIVSQLPSSHVAYTVKLVDHRRVPQKSIHIQIKGQNPNQHIVIGGHVDSINMGWGSSLAPGADDNASGSAAVIQVLKAILLNNYQPQNTIDFFWYAGEEAGLIGSAEIAKSYSAQNINVIAALQLDMLGVPDRGQNIYLEQDFSSPKLNQLLQQVAQNYLPALKINRTSCGYPCSDHSSWYQEKYPVVFPTSGNTSSSEFNRRIHTQNDTSNTINWDYALNVTKLSLAFILTADKEL